MAYDHLIGSGFSRWTQGEYTPGQLEALADTQHSAVLLSGSYRSGKSEILCRIGIRHAILFSGARVGVFRAKRTSLTTSTLRTFLELVHPSWVKSFDNSRLELLLVNGSLVNFLGCDFSDRIGSIELTMGLIDEAHEVSQESFGMIVGRLSGKLNPVANASGLSRDFYEYQQAALNLRQVFLACNPKSRGHWLYENFINSETKKPGFTFYNSNSISNKNLPESYILQNLIAYTRPGHSVEWVKEQIEAIRAGSASPDGLHLAGALTPFGQRNLLGLWVNPEGRIYELDAVIHQVTEWRSYWGEIVARYVGCDFGFHSPRLLEVSETSNGFWVATRYWEGKDVDISVIVEQALRWDQQHPITTLFHPHDQPGTARRLKKELGSFKVAKAKTEVVSGITLCQELVNSETFFFLADNSSHFAACWAEFEGYVWKRDKDGTYLDQPLKEDDHFPDAFRYLVASVAKKRRGSMVNSTPQEPEIPSEIQAYFGISDRPIF